VLDINSSQTTKGLLDVIGNQDRVLLLAARCGRSDVKVS
jgi:hypothetical protein